MARSDGRLISAAVQATIRTADGTAILIDPARRIDAPTPRVRHYGGWSELEETGDGLHMWRGPSKRKEGGTWRRTVPVARLRCQDTEEGHFSHKEREAEDQHRVRRRTWTQEGGSVEGPRRWRGCTDGYRWRRK